MITHRFKIMANKRIFETDAQKRRAAQAIR